VIVRLHLNLGAHRFQSFSRGIMSMVLIADSQRPRREAPPQATLPIRCKLFGPGREDWSRGLRELRWTIQRDGWLSRLPDGTIRLHGILGVNLRLNAAQVARIRQEGLQITASELEIDIGASAFAKALASLPPSGTVLPFVRRALR
jgi:hypothetical protein